MADGSGARPWDGVSLADLAEVALEAPPLHLPPMHAERAGPPPASEQRWAFQPCWHGQRALVHLHGALTNLRIFPPVRVLDPSGHELTDALPELAAMADAGPGTAAILDVVIVVPPTPGHDDERSDARLLYRLEPTEAEVAAERAADQPLEVLVIDLVHLDRHRVGDLPYVQRRSLLLDRLPDGPHWEVPSHTFRPDRHLASMVEHWGSTEVVTKRLDSRYFPGMLSPVWRRVPIEALDLRR